MTTAMSLVIAGLLLVIDFLVAVTCYSLRILSHNRLGKVCHKHNNETRFGMILNCQERAQLAAEIVYTFLTVTLAVHVTVQYVLSRPAPENFLDWVTYTAVGLLFFLVLLSVVVVFPLSIARVAGESFLFRIWPIVNSLVTVSLPVLSVACQIDRILHRLAGLEKPPNDATAALTEEIRTVIDEGQRKGILESEARTMIHRVMKLQEENVAAVMTPRTYMICIKSEATLEEARQRLIDAGHSRVPVIGKSTDDVIGILYAKDLLKYTGDNRNDRRLGDIVREPFYVPETTGINTLLETMKLNRVHLAVVLNEYSGVAGLVTLEDILEEIVGEIADEHDTEPAKPIQRIGPNIVEVEARVHIDDLNEQFGCDLAEAADYDTIGGFVFSHLGRIPESGETFNWQHARITVLEADKRKVLKLRIEVDQSRAAVSTNDG